MLTHIRRHLFGQNVTMSPFQIRTITVLQFFFKGWEFLLICAHLHPLMSVWENRLAHRGSHLFSQNVTSMTGDDAYLFKSVTFQKHNGNGDAEVFVKKLTLLRNCLSETNFEDFCSTINKLPNIALTKFQYFKSVSNQGTYSKLQNMKV